MNLGGMNMDQDKSPDFEALEKGERIVRVFRSIRIIAIFSFVVVLADILLGVFTGNTSGIGFLLVIDALFLGATIYLYFLTSEKQKIRMGRMVHMKSLDPSKIAEVSEINPDHVFSFEDSDLTLFLNTKTKEFQYYLQKRLSDIISLEKISHCHVEIYDTGFVLECDMSDKKLLFQSADKAKFEEIMNLIEKEKVS